ncbi:hypothetical protein SBA2_30026 [Acidobacteriia bacterium SbA2]|nr:hypothetical protein SBA2_30026 [Acidobacteriia bacterium SbA2]
MIDSSPLPWGEGGESSEPGEGFLPTEPRNFGFRVKSIWSYSRKPVKMKTLWMSANSSMKKRV